jgi:hypothetical protein
MDWPGLRAGPEAFPATGPREISLHTPHAVRSISDLHEPVNAWPPLSSFSF